MNRIRRVVNIWRSSGWSGLKIAAGRKLYPAGIWDVYSQEANIYSSWMDFSPSDLQASQLLQKTNAGHLQIQSLTWFLPEFSHAYFGGIFTLLRAANHFKTKHNVWSQFVIIGSTPASQIAEKISTAFPDLKDSPVTTINSYDALSQLKPTDGALCSLWGTAYFLLRFNQTHRKFYFLQDDETLFYPAGSISALVETSYRFGFYGIANTPTIAQIYHDRYGGIAKYFLPCVDSGIFHPTEKPLPEPPYRVFYYGRPAHPRNGFELGVQALIRLKNTLGGQVQILSAGDPWDPSKYGLKDIVNNLGLLSYQQTSELYRSCHAGLLLMFTRHPSYIPLELMASGCLVVSNKNPSTEWFLKDQQNCMLSEASATCLALTLKAGLLDQNKRAEVVSNALKNLNSNQSTWANEMDQIFSFMCNPYSETTIQ